METDVKVEAIVAEIEAADRVELGTFAVPLPVSARPNEQSGYFVRAGLDHLAAFYACWADRDGWTRETEVANERWQVLRFRRGDAAFGLRISTWIMGENQLTFEWPPGATATRVDRTPVGPALPPVTRARPRVVGAPVQAALGDADYLCADGGLVFAAKDHAVWLIDPVARTKTVLAEMVRGTSATLVRGLAIDGGDLLVLTAVPLTIWRVDPVTGASASVEVGFDGFVRGFASIGGVGYACDDERVVSIALASGDAAELGRFPGACAVAAHGGALYVATEHAVHAIDLATGGSRELATLPRMCSSLACDGEALYTLHQRGIGRIDLATGGWTQIAGMPNLGAGNLLALASALADAIAERSVIEAARRMSYDAGGLWFTERAGLRRLALAERFVTTLPL